MFDRDVDGPVSASIAASIRDAHRRHPAEMLADEDAQLSLAMIYELSFQGIEDVDDCWEDDAEVAAVRRTLEKAFDDALVDLVPEQPKSDDVTQTLRSMTDPQGTPGFSHRMARHGDLHDFREILVHRSLYQLREADTHTFAIPRLPAHIKRYLLEVQWDEYGGADLSRMHSQLFAATMDELGLQTRAGYYVDAAPAPTLALLNVLSRFALHRSQVPALIGTLVAIETTSSLPSRHYAAGMRRLGLSARATAFYDEHVEADAVHEQIVVNDLAAGIAHLGPDQAEAIVFGCAAYLALEDQLFAHIASAWEAGRSSLRDCAVTPVREPR